MSYKIESVDPGSPAAKAGICPGESLLTVNGNPIEDILDYRFYTADPVLDVAVSADGTERHVKIVNRNYLPLGLNFSTYLMDSKRSCANRCVFCFIDQLPGGLRDTLYFKDDDHRLSFLMGNYITMTNLSARDLEKIIRLRISPLNISVHTTNPELRIKMCRNKRAGSCLENMRMLAAGGICMNCQIVLCPGLNDGEELRRTLTDLSDESLNIHSVSIVPVGLTAYREGLYPLASVTPEKAAECIDITEEFAEKALKSRGNRIFFASDEFYITAGRSLPEDDFYEDYPQLENGVGMVTLLLTEFREALAGLSVRTQAAARFSLATGCAAAPFLRQAVAELAHVLPDFSCTVYAIENRFFGGDVSVAGLLTGSDYLNSLQGLDLGERLLIPAASLRYDGELFLDDMTLSDLTEKLGLPVIPVPNDGAGLLDALLNRNCDRE